MEKTFPIKESLGVGWKIMKENFIFLAGILLVYYLISSVPSLFKGEEYSILYSILSLAGFVVGLMMQMGIIAISLKFCDNKKPEFKELFHTKNLFNFIVGTLIYGLIVIAGSILLVVPGIYWALKYQFVGYLIVDKGMKPMEALKKSGEMTNGLKWNLLGFYLVILGVNLLGLLALGIGLLVTVPTTTLAYAYVYRKISGGSLTASPTPTTPPAATV